MGPRQRAAERQGRHQRHQRPVDVLRLPFHHVLLAQRGQLPVQHQLPSQGRAQAVVRSVWEQEGRRRPREGVQELPVHEDARRPRPAASHHDNVQPQVAAECPCSGLQAAAIPRRVRGDLSKILPRRVQPRAQHRRGRELCHSRLDRAGGRGQRALPLVRPAGRLFPRPPHIHDDRAPRRAEGVRDLQAAAERGRARREGRNGPPEQAHQGWGPRRVGRHQPASKSVGPARRGERQLRRQAPLPRLQARVLLLRRCVRVQPIQGELSPPQPLHVPLPHRTQVPHDLEHQEGDVRNSGSGPKQVRGTTEE
mmetsp:Transcript_5386/g.15828  ORF Transcript_5386/g.15828 Transcript_5386/m.15828 type:complete len:309 (+) Transcript_5386:886-1812(+)